MALLVALVVSGCFGSKPAGVDDAEVPDEPAPAAPTVVVATFDTGTNPFHPCFSRPGFDASTANIPGFPADARPLHLGWTDDYAGSLAASQDALDALEPWMLYHVPGTNLLFYGGTEAATEFIDDYPHGAQASSQIVCADYGLAPEAWLVVLNWYDNFAENDEKMAWVAQQEWIDVVHLNIQDTPSPQPDALTEGIRGLVAAGQFVVIAAGNGVSGGGASYPMELSSYNGPVGSLIAGANENEGYTLYSNLDPHVVMDGCGTVSAAPDSFGEDTFSGTSSASPRITGYVAQTLLQIRTALGGSQARVDDVLASATSVGAHNATAYGPMEDGKLTVAELHEAIRKTADPNPADSKFDGSGGCVYWIPQPTDLPSSFYTKMGYGEVSEFTLPHTVAVALGDEEMPARPNEDRFFEASEKVRREYWG